VKTALLDAIKAGDLQRVKLTIEMDGAPLTGYLEIIGGGYDTAVAYTVQKIWEAAGSQRLARNSGTLTTSLKRGSFVARLLPILHYLVNKEPVPQPERDTLVRDLDTFIFNAQGDTAAIPVALENAKAILLTPTTALPLTRDQLLNPAAPGVGAPEGGPVAVDQQGIAAALGLPAQPSTGAEVEMRSPAASAAPAVPPLPSFEMEQGPPDGDIPVMVGEPPLPPPLAPLARLVPDDAANVSQRLLPTTKAPTKGSWWHENATAVRDLVGAWYDKWKRLPKEEKKASKEEAEGARNALQAIEGAPQLSAFGSNQVVQLGGDALLAAITEELEALKGGAVRKRTFKRRRGEKQNGRRVSRRRKDRTNRSHSHTR
jgi:hypothetical protein